ncbi:DUF2153 domain-containing protein [Staphylothermus hellenicus]|uniref:DUF2153 domain-containing protein n=1 Tax=Staphylothermus hellenicus (strain DSM 12710 / JCM 10830 / BK20S6-10-b1 / P8) TaxID=591019 RepID=D7D917_STAHD|nr:DUF2153 domain-containing protein [Staphylothermus hellenicus]ADI32263.1 conserved hypothetical protein [Staphylothermus hellenicus DSM 12710]
MDGYFPNLEAWVKRQEEIKESFMKAEENYEKLDRLELILLSRQAFQHMLRTIEAFDQWLKEPMVISHMPREMLVDLWAKLRTIFYQLLDLDIEHTSKFNEYIKKLAKEGKLNPILTIGKREKETRRFQITPSM